MNAAMTLCASLAGLLLAGGENHAASDCGSPDATVSRHLAAIRTRDLAGIEATITRHDRLLLILPNGVRTDSREDYLRFHRSFFDDESWQMSFDEVSRISTASLTLVSLKSNFRDSADSAVRSSWLSMGFGCESGDWRLVFDQNTRLP